MFWEWSHPDEKPEKDWRWISTFNSERQLLGSLGSILITVGRIWVKSFLYWMSVCANLMRGRDSRARGLLTLRPWISVMNEWVQWYEEGSLLRRSGLEILGWVLCLMWVSEDVKGSSLLRGEARSLALLWGRCVISGVSIFWSYFILELDAQRNL